MTQMIFLRLCHSDCTVDVDHIDLNIRCVDFRRISPRNLFTKIMPKSSRYD